MLRPSYVRLAIVAALAGSVVPAVAQDRVEGEEPGASAGLEEIVVTARRRSENLQDVPVSIQAFSEEEITLRGLERVEDIVAAAPNVMVSAGPSTAYNTFAMRGIPRAGFFVDDVWQQSSISLSQRSVMDLERVEILRGPQGTLYGRDTTGGAIRLYTRRPAEVFGVRARATVGSYDRRDLSIHADFPLTETLLSKVSVSSAQRDGYVRSLTVNRAYGDIDDQRVIGDLLWTPNDKLQVRFTAEDFKFEGTQANVTLHIFDPGEPGVDAGFVDPLGRSIFWVPNSQYYQLVGLQYDCQSHVMNCPGGEVGDLETKSDYNEGPGIIIDQQNYNLRFEYSLTDSINVSSLTHYHEQWSWDYNHFDAAEINYFSQGSTAERDGWTQEFQFTGDHGRLNWLVGVYGWEEEVFDHFMRWALWEFATGEFDFADVANSPECQSWNPASGLAPCIQVPPSQDSMTSSLEEGYAVFGEVTFDITDALSVTVGARYHDQDNTEWTELFAPETARRSDIPGRLPPGDTLISAGRTDELKNNFSQDTYRLAVTYNFDDTKMVYTGYSQGYNAGGISRVQVFDLDNNAVNFDFPFDPEQIDNYEVGLRSDWLERTLRVNATVFFTEWEDIQLQGTVTNPFTGVVLPTFLTTNAATAEAKGAEFEITYLPAEQWQFDLDVGFLDTKYTSIAEGSELGLGDSFGMAPELQYSFGSQWDGNLPNGAGVMLRLDYMYTDGYNRTYVPGDHSTRYTGEEFEQDAFGLLNARLTFTPPEGNWEVAIFGTNLTDERYTDGGFMSPLLQIDDGTIGRPREAGVSLSFTFE
jgi:iron complex outermembrane receptor protein